MSAGKRAELEKKGVAGLVILFLITLAMGPLKSLGLMKGRLSNSAGGAPSVNAGQSKSLLSLLQSRRDKINAPANLAVAVPPPDPPAPPAAYTAQTLRDPLRSLLPGASQQGAKSHSDGQASQAAGGASAAMAAPPALQLQGLLWGGRQPRAIINGRVYTVDDEIEGAKIISIDRRGVTIEHHGKPVLYPPVSSSIARAGEGHQAQPSQRR